MEDKELGNSEAERKFQSLEVEGKKQALKQLILTLPTSTQYLCEEEA